MSLAVADTAREAVVAGLMRQDDTAGRTDVDATFDGARGRPPTTVRTDVAIVHPAAASSVSAASKHAGAAAKAREARKNTRYAVACKPDAFYGAIAETGGRISSGFVALLLTLATIYTSAAGGFDELDRRLQASAISSTLASYYGIISAGTRRATASSTRRAALRICSLSSISAQPSRRGQRHNFRGRVATKTQLLTRILDTDRGRF
jgi:hypothetical protein